MQNFVKEFRFGQCKYIHKLEINEKKWVGMGWNGVKWLGMGWNGLGNYGGIRRV